MSALTMILLAGIAVGDVPKKEAGEVAEQCLDLHGKWEGTWEDEDGKVWRATLEGEELTGCAGNFERHWIHFSISADKKMPGNLAINHSNVVFFQGIYEQQENHVRMCFRESSRGRPVRFRGGNGQHLLTLHRVKSSK